MGTAERLAWLFLNRVPLLSPLRFWRLYETAGSCAGILDLPVARLQAAEVEEAVAARWQRSFRDRKLWRLAEDELQREQKGQFRCVTGADPDYPASLNELIGRPPVLYVRGRWPMDPVCPIGMVGTRRASHYGETTAERLTADLIDRGCSTVSGMAAGIDAVVHRVTLNKEGSTVGALGHGLAHIFPKENRALFERMVERGTLVTEFPFEAPPEAYHFPRRNRIISGLSQGVVVIEAPRRSGALITARYAAEQGREVFAVPGPISSSLQAGCHRLIRDGAKLVECAEDILEELRARPDRPRDRDSTLPSGSGGARDASADNQADLTELERRVVRQAIGQPISVDELASALTCPVDQLGEALLHLELTGRIHRLPGQRYVTYKN